MSNPFANWTLEMVNEFNAKARGFKRPLANMMKPPLPEPLERPFAGVVEPPKVRQPFALGLSTDEAKLNKTERAFLLHLRAVIKPDSLWIQALTLKIGNDCRYTPDFAGIFDGQFIFWEVKGFMREDAAVKLKVAARMYRSMARLVLVKRDKTKPFGWSMEEVKP